MLLGLFSPLLLEEVFKDLSQNRTLSGCVALSGRGGGGARGGLHGFPSRQSPTAADVEQIVDIPVRGGLPDFLPGQGSAASSSRRLHDHADEGIEGVFRTFPRSKKSPKVARQSGAELLGHVSSWTPVPHHGGFFVDEAPDEALADIVLQPNMWRDEAVYVWMHFSSNPSRWHLLQNSAV